MPVGQPMPQVARYTGVIITCDPTVSPPVIEAQLKGADARTITIVAVGTAWRWPEVGETWVIRQENGSWYLEGPAMPPSYADVTPGDTILNAPTGTVRVLGSKDGSTDFAFNSSSHFALGDFIPSAAVARPGCLLCDGTAYTLSAHPELSTLATACPQYVSSGVLTVPDLRGVGLIGADPTGRHMPTLEPALGATVGSETVKLTSDESGVPPHSHGVSDPGHSHSAQSGTNGYTGGTAGGYYFTNNPPTHPNYGGLINNSFTGIGIQNNAAADAANPHANVQPSHAVNWFIYAGI